MFIVPSSLSPAYPKFQAFGMAYIYNPTSSTIPTGNITISAAGTSGAYLTASPSWTTATNPYVYTTAGTNGTSSPSLQVTGDAEIKGELTVQGISVSETLKKINERLAILVPDPVLLEKYEALKQAYDHYKLLEALCVEQNNPPPTV